MPDLRPGARRRCLAHTHGSPGRRSGRRQPRPPPRLPPFPARRPWAFLRRTHQRSCLLGSLAGRFASHRPTSPRNGRPLHHTDDSRQSLLTRLFPCHSGCRRFLACARLGGLSFMGGFPHSFCVPSSPRRWGPCSPRVATRCHARHFYILPRAGRASLPYSSWPSLSRPSGWRLAHSHPAAIAAAIATRRPPLRGWASCPRLRGCPWCPRRPRPGVPTKWRARQTGGHSGTCLATRRSGRRRPGCPWLSPSNCWPTHPRQLHQATNADWTSWSMAPPPMGKLCAATPRWWALWPGPWGTQSITGFYNP